MYENDSKQSLPAKEYRELLGSALCVFSSNNGFRITSKHGEQVFATKTLKKDGTEMSAEVTEILDNVHQMSTGDRFKFCVNEKN